MTANADRTDGVNFIIRKDDWRQCRFVDAAVPDQLASNEVLLRVNRFALTSNNISYALAGDMLGYWNFFPTEEGWGRLPTMGFADVLRSRHSEVAEGERVFGFFPMSKHLVVKADQASPSHFFDAAAHRSETAPIYRQYTRAAQDPLYDARFEDQIVLLRGLFMTSFLVDDFIADNDLFGARAFVVSSASSKTSIALGHLLSKNARGRVIGLTSPRNEAFVKSLGCFDQTTLYDDIESLPGDTPVVFIDMAGNADVVRRLHNHFGDNMKHDCTVGATHWDRGGATDDLPGAAPVFFFAPTQAQKRSQDWGPAGFQERLAGAWQGFLADSDKWLSVVRGVGRENVERVYKTILEGRAEPHEGHVLSLWEQD